MSSPHSSSKKSKNSLSFGTRVKTCRHKKYHVVNQDDKGYRLKCNKCGLVTSLIRWEDRP